jgi:hypothetical protein
MKTLRLLLLLSFIAVFAMNTAQAQPPVIKGLIEYDMSTQYFPCADEYFIGTVTVEYKIMPHLYMEKPFKIQLIGATTGNVYELTQNYRGTFYLPFNGREITDGSTATIRLNGKLIAVLHWTYHLTVNKNGEVTVETVNFFWDCH